jgi:hypothetical protein
LERQWNKIGALAGVVSAMVAIVGIIVAMMAWLFPEQPATSEVSSAAAAKERLQIRIAPSSYDVSHSSWKPYGPFYEAKSDLYSRYGVTHAHSYGQSTGRFVYRVDIGSFEGARAELKARLSADAVGYSDPANKYSDVTLAINDTPLQVQRVMPDDGRGGYYTWQFDAKLLRHGQNTIEFIVEQNAQFPNGLCIYGDAIAPGYTDEWITLQTE